MRKSILFTLFAFTFSISTQAQIEQIFAADGDASTYVEHYLNPAINGLMYDLSNGWYSRSNTHKKFGFDVSFSASLAIIPESEKYFQFVASEYDNLTLQGGDGQLPTIAGSETSETLEIGLPLNQVYPIDAIDGLGDKWMKEFFIPLSIPTPMIQAGFGLPLNTDIKLRFFPNTEREGIAFNLFGLGLKHNLSQYFIKSDKDLFTVSALGAFTKTNVTYTPNNSEIPGNNQSLEMSINAYTAQAIAGVNLKIVNFYLGFGYVGGTTDLGAKGSYNFDVDNNGSSDLVVTDPLDLNFEMTGFKTTLGTRFNFGPVKIFGDYTFQEFPSVTAGVVFSLQ